MLALTLFKICRRQRDVLNLIRCHYQTSSFQNPVTCSWFSHVASLLLKSIEIKSSKPSKFQSFPSPSLTIAVYLVLCSIFSRSFFCLTLWEIHCPKVTKTNDIPPKKHILINAINFTAKGKFKDRTSRADEVGEGKWVCSGRRWKEVAQWSSDVTVYSWQTYWNIKWPNLLNWPNLFT